MNNQNLIETPEDKKKGNMWSWISLGCYVSQFVINVAVVILSGALSTTFTEIEELSELTYGLSEIIVTIGSCVSGLASIAALVIMIYVRVKYPKNIFGKVLMWVYIALFIMYIVAMVAIIIACGIACNACMDDCYGVRLAVERWMLC